mmetsp:Transcript_503/g.1435  ORF Transcript_503/g.1435 Transcript_503/m.1435 type:complete len:304 (+) Transcript_503:109-1020(+)
MSVEYAMAGCNMDKLHWDLWWTIVAVVNWLYGIILLAAPLDLLPYHGKWKWLLLHPFAALSDITEHEWDPVSVSASLGAGNHFVTIGLFVHWAAPGGDEEFTFGLVVLISEIIAILTWCYAYKRYCDQWRWTIFLSLNGHIAMFVIALVLVSDYKTDQHQLQAGGDKSDAGSLLWALVGIRAFYTLVWLTSSVKDTAPLSLKPVYRYDRTRFATLMNTCRVSTSIQVLLILLWAGLYYNGGSYGYNFPLAFWAGLLGTYVAFSTLVVIQEDMWRAQAVLASATVYVATASITIALWYSDCHLE